jgi:hypothetical protein
LAVHCLHCFVKALRHRCGYAQWVMHYAMKAVGDASPA